MGVSTLFSVAHARLAGLWASGYSFASVSHSHCRSAGLTDETHKMFIWLTKLCSEQSISFFLSPVLRSSISHTVYVLTVPAQPDFPDTTMAREND